MARQRPPGRRFFAAGVMPTPQLELFYGGRYFKGDSIRLCLAYAKIPVDDVREGHASWPCVAPPHPHPHPPIASPATASVAEPPAPARPSQTLAVAPGSSWR